jgi:hypothetical protein
MLTRCNRCLLLQILLLAQHVSGTRFSSCRYAVELRVVCPFYFHILTTMHGQNHFKSMRSYAFKPLLNFQLIHLVFIVSMANVFPVNATIFINVVLSSANNNQHVCHLDQSVEKFPRLLSGKLHTLKIFSWILIYLTNFLYVRNRYNGCER